MDPTQQVLGTDNEIGPKAFRRRSRQPGAFTPVAFRFLEDDYKTFVNWWKTSLNYGHKWFWIELPSAGGITWHVVRFAERYVAKLEGHRYWTVTAKLELRDRRFEPYSRTNNYAFLEDFESGFGAYDLILGSLDPFSIVEGMTEHCMHAERYTAATQAIIERVLDTPVLCDYLSFRFRVTEFGADDALSLALKNGPTSHFDIIPCREGFYDPARRVLAGFGSGIIPVSPTQVNLNEVYRVECVMGSGSNGTALNLYHEPSGTMLQQTLFTKEPFTFDRIRFTLDPSVTTCETDYDDIYVLTYA